MTEGLAKLLFGEGTGMVEQQRLEFAGLPTGLAPLGLALAGILIVLVIYALYRREAKHLRLGPRWILATLRLSALTIVGIMLLELVLVTTRTERSPATLVVVVDDSQSMGLTDPYRDEVAAGRTAEAVGLASSDLATLRSLARLELVKRAFEPIWPALARGRNVHLSGLGETTARNSGSTNVGANDALDGSQADATTTARPNEAAEEARLALELLRPVRPTSPLGDAMRRQLTALRGQPIAGVVLISDGRHNSGEDPLRLLEDAELRAVPIHAVAVGTNEPVRNARVVELVGNPAVFLRDETRLEALVEAEGIEDTPATLLLESRIVGGDWVQVAEQEITLGNASVLRVPFDLRPDTLGEFEYRARLEGIADERTLEDNIAQTTLRVVRQRIRVLLIAGSATPEVQFLRNALLRDRQIDFSSWLQHASPDYEHAGDRPIRRLPASDVELANYDCLILIDPDFQDLDSRWPAMLTRFVGQEGGGLIYVAGELFSPALFQARDGRGDWLRILPVARDRGLYESDAEVRLGSATTYAIELTPAGLVDPIFRFAADEERNRRIFASLPGMYWHFPVTRAKPGATVLARHGDPRMSNQFGRHVLIATQFYGPGRTVFIGFDSTYRWRYLDEDYFDGLWARLVDRVGRSKALGGRHPFTLTLDKSRYRAFDRVTLRVRLREGMDVDPTQWIAEIEPIGRPPETIQLEPVPGQSDEWTWSFVPEESGAYTIRLSQGGVESVPGIESVARPASVQFRVEPPQRELDEATLNRALLEDLARRTGGRVWTLPELGGLDEAIRIREVERTLETRRELWDSPLLFGTLVALLTLEWILRKWYRLV